MLESEANIYITMTEYLSLLIGTVLVNNFVLGKFWAYVLLWAYQKTRDRHWHGVGDDIRPHLSFGVRLSGGKLRVTFARH